MIAGRMTSATDYFRAGGELDQIERARAAGELGCGRDHPSPPSRGRADRLFLEARRSLRKALRAQLTAGHPPWRLAPVVKDITAIPVEVGSRGGHVRCSYGALNDIAWLRGAQRRAHGLRDVECGGWLIASGHNALFTILGATGAGSTARHGEDEICGFTPDNAEEIVKVEGGVVAGLWHTHPSGARGNSQADLRQYGREVLRTGKPFVSFLVTRGTATAHDTPYEGMTIDAYRTSLEDGELITERVELRQVCD